MHLWCLAVAATVLAAHAGMAQDPTNSPASIPTGAPNTGTASTAQPYPTNAAATSAYNSCVLSVLQASETGSMVDPGGRFSIPEACLPAGSSTDSATYTFVQGTSTTLLGPTPTSASSSPSTSARPSSTTSTSTTAAAAMPGPADASAPRSRPPAIFAFVGAAVRGARSVLWQHWMDDMA